MEKIISPELARREVAKLMADGRWRTANDAMHRLGIPNGQAQTALQALARIGIVDRDAIVSGRTTITMYRRTAG